MCPSYRPGTRAEGGVGYASLPKMALRLVNISIYSGVGTSFVQVYIIYTIFPGIVKPLRKINRELFPDFLSIPIEQNRRWDKRQSQKPQQRVAPS